MADAAKQNLLILGDAQVGKTAIMHRFVDEKFSVDMKHTVGMAFLTKVMVRNVFSRVAHNEGGFWHDGEGPGVGYRWAGVFVFY